MSESLRLNRRTVLKGITAGFAGLSLPISTRALTPERKPGKLTIGLITDLHHGKGVPDADARLDVYLQAVADRGDVDMLMQLGDFCNPVDNARDLCKRFNAFDGPKLHVLGNHDMDFGSKEQIMDYWGMPARYGSTDIGGYHFVTLDRNNIKSDNKFVPYKNANFYIDRAMRAWADDEQLEWLAADLARTDLPTIVLTHQALGMSKGGTEDAGERVASIMKIMEKANRDAGWTKVQACFCGHSHADRALVHEGIHYILFNSASYKWYGEPVRYKDTLYAFVTLDPAGTLTVEGRETTWEDPTPKQRGLEGEFPNPAISNREFKTRAANSAGQ